MEEIIRDTNHTPFWTSQATASDTGKMKMAFTVVLFGLLLVRPLPEAEAFAPIAAVAVSCHCRRQEFWATQRPRLTVGPRREVEGALALSCGHGSGTGHDTAHEMVAEPAEWTAEITGDEKFDTAWMAAWKSKDSIRCPFFKRRATDVLEAALAVGRFILARHKSLLSLAPRSKGGAKITGLTAEALLARIRSDFEDRSYYVTGKMTREIYSDACFFDAPDPDMPVSGLEKYIDAISNLFETRKSKVDLLDLQVCASASASASVLGADVSSRGLGAVAQGGCRCKSQIQKT